MHLGINKHKVGTLAVLLSSSLALNACMSGTPHSANNAASNKIGESGVTSQVESNPIVMSQFGQLSLGNASYPLEISNLSSDTYDLKAIRLENIFTKNKESGDILKVEPIELKNKVISAHGGFTLKLSSQASRVGVVKLLVDVVNRRTNKSQTLQQTIRVSGHNYTNQGLIYDDNPIVHLNNRYYDFSLPIILDKDFVGLSSTNGELECTNGYSHGSGCVLRFSGYAIESTNYSFRLFGDTVSHEHISVNGQLLLSQASSSFVRNSGAFLVQPKLTMDKEEREASIPVTVGMPVSGLKVSLEDPQNLTLEGSTCEENYSENGFCDIFISAPIDGKKVTGNVVISAKGSDGTEYTSKVDVFRLDNIIREPDIEFTSLPDKLTAYRGDIAKFDVQLKNIGKLNLNNAKVIIPSLNCGAISFDPKAKVCELELNSIMVTNQVPKDFPIYFKPGFSFTTTPAMFSIIVNGLYSTSLAYNSSSPPITYAALEADTNVLGIDIKQPSLNITPGGNSKTSIVNLTNLLNELPITITSISVVDPEGKDLAILGLSTDPTACLKRLNASETCQVKVKFGPLASEQSVPQTPFKLKINFNAGIGRVTKLSDNFSAVANYNQNKVTVDYVGLEPLDGAELKTEQIAGNTVYGMAKDKRAALLYNVTNNFDESVNFSISLAGNGVLPSKHEIDRTCGSLIKPHDSCTVQLVRTISDRINPMRFGTVRYQITKTADGSSVIDKTLFPNSNDTIIVYGYGADENGNPKVDVTVGTDYDKSSGKFNPDKISTIGNEGDSFTVFATVSGYNPSDDVPLTINPTFSATGDADGRYSNTMHVERIDSCRTKLTDTTPARCQYRFTQNTPIQYNRDFDGNNNEHYDSAFNNSGDRIKGFYFHFPDIRYVTFSTDTSNVTLHDFVGAGKKKVFNYFLGTTRREYDRDVKIVDGRRFDYFNCSKQSRDKARYRGNIHNSVVHYYSRDDNDPELKLNMPGHYAQLPDKIHYPGLIYGSCNKKLAERVTNNWEDHFGWQICTHCVRPWFTRGGGWIENTME